MDLSLIARSPDDPLLRQPGGVVTAACFLEDARRAARDLAGQSAPGSLVLNLCRDRYAFILAFAAATLAGQVSLLGSDRSPERLRAMAVRYPSAIVVSDGPIPPIGLPIVELAGISNGAARKPTRRPSASGPGLPLVPGSQIVAHVFTSGSTGEAVPHAKSWAGLVARSAAAASRFELDEGRPASIVGTVPPQHMYGLETTILLPLHAAACSWCGPAFYPDDIRAALDAMPAPRLLVTTPLQLRALLTAGTALPPLQAIVSASAPLPLALAAEAEQRWDTQVIEIFGATEVGSIASRRPVAGEVWRLYRGVTLSPSPDGRKTLVQAESGPPEILQDILELTADNGFRLIDRQSDVVKIGGRRASLSGLNQILTAIDGVEDGVFVAPAEEDDRPGRRMQVFVVAPDRTAGEILAALRQRIDPAFLPRALVCVDVLPRNEMGKLPKSALAALQMNAAREGLT